jgi:hypothetical protein
MDIGEKIKEQVNLAAKEAQKYTCQLFYDLKKIGSGFFIEIDNNFFLISAAHVLEQSYISGMNFPNGNELVSINGILLITVPDKGDSRSSDKIDFSVIKLDDSTIHEVKKKFKFLPSNLLDIDHQPQMNPQYMLFGYPVEWTKVIASKKQLIPKPLIVRTKTIDVTSRKMLQYNHASKILVEYNSQSFINGNEGEKLPDCKGMSGSALWYIPLQNFIERGELILKLVGLITDYHGDWKDGDVIAATKLSVITESIRQKMDVKIEKSDQIKLKLENPE